MKLLAVRDDGAQLAADDDMFYGVLMTPEGSGVIPVASVLARGDWHDGYGLVDVPQHLEEWATQASQERDQITQRWEPRPAQQLAQKAAAKPDAAAFLLLRARNEEGKWRYLLQKRPDGTWGLPGGGLHPGEDPWEGAVRESSEEMGDLPDNLKPRVTMQHEQDDGLGVYTFVVDLPDQFTPAVDGETPEETEGWGWFRKRDIEDLPLNDGFAETWDSISWKELGKTAVTGLEKKYNPLELRDRHGRWVKYDFDTSEPDLVGTGSGNPYDDEDQDIYHEDHGLGRIYTVTRGRDNRHYAVVNFDDGTTKAFRYRDPDPKEQREGWFLSFHQHEAQREDIKAPTFDRSAIAAMKRLQSAVSKYGLKKTKVSVSPMPYDADAEYMHEVAYGRTPIGTAINRYVSPESMINKDLRSGSLSEGDRSDISVLDAELAKEKLLRPAVLYRGFTASPESLAKMVPGSTFTDHAYVSTADGPSYAKQFAVLRAFGTVPRSMLPKVTAHGGKPVIMKITVPRGGHVIKGESDISEWVLPRDTTFKVTDVSPDGSLISVEATPETVAKYRQASLLKVGPEGYIHGYICVRPPCGPKYIEASLNPETGEITHPGPGGTFLGSSGKNADGTYSAYYDPLGSLLQGHYKTQQDAAKAVALYHNIGMLKEEATHWALDLAERNLAGAMGHLVNGNHDQAEKMLDQARGAARVANAYELYRHIEDTQQALHDAPKPAGKRARSEPPEFDEAKAAEFLASLKAERDEAAKRLAAARASGIKSERKPNVTGTQGETSLVTFNDGSTWVHKVFDEGTGDPYDVNLRSAIGSVKREEAGSLVARAFGVKSPVVLPGDKPTEIYMTLVPGKTVAGSGDSLASMRLGGTKTEQNALSRMGVLDHAIKNSDRHTGNVMEDAGGNVYAIDHNSTWEEGSSYGSSLTRKIKSSDLSPETYTEMHQNLEALKPEFDRIFGPYDYHLQDSLTQLDDWIAGGFG